MAQRIVMVRFKRALPPGTYAVSWHMVSVHRPEIPKCAAETGPRNVAKKRLNAEFGTEERPDASA
jgi:hypothetical protein